MQHDSVQRKIHRQLSRIHGDTFQLKLDNLSRCNCCDRHQRNKPTVYSRWEDTPATWNGGNCNCSCRHYARFICRQFPNPFIQPTKRPKVFSVTSPVSFTNSDDSNSDSDHDNDDNNGAVCEDVL